MELQHRSTSMLIKTQGRRDNTWNLYVDGRLEMLRESHSIVSRVADALRNGIPTGSEELEEIVTSIRADCARREERKWAEAQEDES
jgi:hypothetical protein